MSSCSSSTIAVSSKVYSPQNWPGASGGVDRRDRADLERVSRTERLHGRVLLAEIGIDRRDPLDRRAEILDRRRWRLDQGPVRLSDADQRNLEAFGRGVVAEHDLPPLLNAGFALRLDAQVRSRAAPSRRPRNAATPATVRSRPLLRPEARRAAARRARPTTARGARVRRFDVSCACLSGEKYSTSAVCEWLSLSLSS